MPKFEVSISIQAPKQKVYKIAREMEKFPQFMRDVKKVKVLEMFDNKTITYWESELEGTPICWKELDEFNDEKPSIKYKLLEGDLDKFEGEWIFKEEGDNTKVILTVDYDFGMPAFEGIVGPVLKIKVKENSIMMLEGIKEKAEGRVKVPYQDTNKIKKRKKH